MESTNVHLFKATDAEDAYALAVDGDPTGTYRAERGYGASFQKIWSIEIQSSRKPDLGQVDWEVLLERAIEAYDLNDPVLASFEWPLRQTA